MPSDPSASASTTPRRSKRYLPVVAKSKRRDDAHYQWLDQPFSERVSVPEDLAGDNDSDLDEDSEMTTAFYTRFRRSPPDAEKKSKAGLKGKGKQVLQAETYAVGDTVLVQSMRKQPSVAVITAMWCLKDGDERIIKVKIHWFLRPEELPKTGVEHTHRDDEVYYSLEDSSVISPQNVICHCSVTSTQPEAPKGGPRQSRQGDKRTSFFCKLAYDPQRGLYYDFDWDDFREDRLALDPDDTGDSWDPEVERVYEGSPRKKRATAPSQAGSGEESGSEAPQPSPRKRKLSKKLGTNRKKQVADESDEDGLDFIPKTPSKRRKVSKGLLEIDSDEGSGTSDHSRNPFTTPKKGRTTEKRGRKRPGRKRQAGVSEDEDSGVEYEPSDQGSDASSESDASDDNQHVSDAEDSAHDDDVPRTPAKRRLLSQTTPSRSKRTRKTVVPTPHSRAALKARSLKAKSRAAPLLPPAFAAQTSDVKKLNLPKDPWLRAMQVLHVGARPDALPCREDQYSHILRVTEELLDEGSGGCVYISGVPGTGKTATVHAIVRELKRMAERHETNPFTYVEINGLRVPEPAAAYTLLWEAVSGHDTATDGPLKISAKEALKNLTRHFSSKARVGPGRHAFVVLMDELDQLITTKQDVVYNFFNWPTLVDSRLIVIAVANTHDLPERVMTGRVRSRLGMVRINFSPYKHEQLQTIVNARLATTKDPSASDETVVIGQDAILFAAKKVASIAGDARRVLDICRKAVELVKPLNRAATISDVSNVIKSMQNSPTAAFLEDCSLHERIMLVALLKCVRKHGVEEVMWADLQYMHMQITNQLTTDEESHRKPSLAELRIVLNSLLASHAMIMEGGAIAARKPDGERKIVLNIEQSEVERTLSEVNENWKKMLAVE